MVDSFSPYSTVSKDGSAQLDSTKRCLFPAENEPPMECLRSGNLPSEYSEFPSIEKALSVEESQSSPISVLSVLCGTDTTINTKVENRLPVSSPSSQNRVPFNCDTVYEEQNEIEIQYVESGHSNQSRNEKENNCNTAINSSHVRRTPSSLRDLRTKPLLDSEKTPSKGQTATTPLVGCGGRSCVALCDDRSHQLLERTIAGFLENSPVATTPDAIKKACTDWQNWSYFGFGRGKENSIDDAKENVSKEDIRSNLRHRTSRSLRSRKAGIRQLKNNIAPFAPSPSRSPARAPDLFRNRSFSVSDHRSAIVRVSEDRKSDKRSFPDVLELCTMYESIQLDSPGFVRAHTPKKMEDDELSYGSDPEDFTRRRLLSGARTPNASDSFDSQYLNQSQNSISSPSRSFHDVCNDQLFSTIVQEMFNKTTTLVLHPILDQNRPGAVQSSRPLAVDAWVERGQHLAYALVQPKWIWKTKGQIVGQQSSARQKFCVQGIELLDITKILKMEDTDECTESFAKASHCFIMKSIYHEEFCFEAKSRSERNRIVDSLKLLIARFGAQVLTGDDQVYYEFFWTGDAAPGEAPDFRECFGQEEGQRRRECSEA